MDKFVLSKYPHSLEPSFWTIILKASVSNRPDIAAELYQSRCVAYTRQEAIDTVLEQLRVKHHETFLRGNKLGGWKIAHVESITATDMQEMFNERTQKEKEDYKTRYNVEHNELLQTIIATKDVNLLHDAIRQGKITENERLYLHDKLTGK